MTDNPNPTPITDLSEERQRRPQKMRNGELLPPWMTYDPPRPYLVSPCQVLSLPVKKRPPSEKSEGPLLN